MKKRVLITGANGLLGQKLVQLLLEDPLYDLIATGRGDNRLPYKDKGYTYVSLDITDNEQVDEIVTKLKPEVIINTAAMTNVDQCEDDREACWMQNVQAVQNMVDAAEKNKCFLIHLSTDFIFDGQEGPYDEDATPKPLSYYGETKLGAEKIIKQSKIKWAIARTVLVYGIAHDMSRSNIILWVKKNLEDKKPIQVVDDQFRSPTLAEDLAMGCYLLMENGATGIYNISGKEVLTPYQMAIKTAEFFNLDKSLITKTDSTKFKQRAPRPLKTGFLIDKAINKLGYDPNSFEEGIKLISEQMANR
ncbi:SDR family oxidoreductase [Cytophagaceae bacterium ABcell3]|nr:SDR family oxidoreductase [Cytophagaceae bacterium ABcell3]